MIKKAWQLFVAFVLWALFAVVALAGFALGVAAAALGSAESIHYAARVFRAMDRLAAVVLDVGDGSRTVSAECGRSECRFCRVLCAVLSVILEPDHCRKEGNAQV